MTGRKSQSAESSSDANNNELIAKLLKKIEDLERRVNEGSVAKNDIDEFETQDNFNQIKINQDDYIKVISLCPYQLNLCTEKNGGGKVFTFYSFGEVKRILYADLAKIIETNRGFLEKFYFYIMDKRCIRRHGLDDLYEKALTKERIEVILDGKSNDIVSLFKSGNPIQQELIVDMLIQKMVKTPESVDLNMIDKISRVSGIKIQEKAERARELKEENN
jgi:hypothetical protein